MTVDWVMVGAVIISVIAGFIIFYAYNSHAKNVVNKAYKVIVTLFDTYGLKIKVDDPQLYDDISDAIKTMDRAMADKHISVEETFEIIATYVPLSKRLTAFIKEKY